jgi:acyl-CoA synthetase (AMP-forming)/AMP-acid ligase II
MKIEAGGPFSLAALKFPERPAIRDCSGQSWTFTELRERANRFGSGLLRRGVLEGERVAVLSYNRNEVVECWLGLERFNVVRVVLHSHFEMDTHVHTVNEVGAKVFVFDARFATAVDQVRAKLQSVKTFVCIGSGTPDWAIAYETLLQAGTPNDPCLTIDEESPCFLQLTSGTTGAPKPWVHSHRSWRALVANNLEHLDTFGPNTGSIGTQDVNLHFHALQWATGFQTLLPYILRGSLTIILDDEMFDPKKVVDEIIRSHVTGVFVPGPMLPPMLDIVERAKAQHRLARVVIFFATPELLDRTTNVLGKVWCHGFGSSEQGAPTTRLSWSDVDASRVRIESVGRPASLFFELAIVDEHGKRLAAGEVGEIVVRSAMSTGAYWGYPEKTDESFFPDGWFRPHDVGYIDQEGFLFYLDRAKDRITTPNGVVYPHMVETAVLRHTHVANCGVVGLGESGRQSVVAAVLLKDGLAQSPTLASEIVANCNELPEYQVPKDIVFVDDLPTVLGGAKVQRAVLAQRLIEQRAQ